MYKLSSLYSFTSSFTTPYPAVLESYVNTKVEPGFTEENTVQNINLISINKNTKPPTSALSL